MDYNEKLSFHNDFNKIIFYKEDSLVREFAKEELRVYEFTYDFEQYNAQKELLIKLIDFIGSSVEQVESKLTDETQKELHRRLVSRILSAIGASKNLLVVGYYNETAVLLRIILEYSNLYLYLMLNPNKIEKWFKKPANHEFKPKIIRNKIQGTNKVISKKYNDLSRFIHPNPKKSLNAVMGENPDNLLYFRSPIFSPSKLSEITIMFISCMIEFQQELIFVLWDKLNDKKQAEKLDLQLSEIKEEFPESKILG